MKGRPFPYVTLTLLWAAGVQATPPLGPEFPLDTTLAYNQARNDQRFPAITFDGSNYFVVWQDLRRELDYDIIGTRIAFDGTVLDPGGIVISMAPEFQSYPAVATGISNSLVVWVDGRDIESGSGLDLYGTRVTPSGVVLDPTGIFISTGLSNPWFPKVAFGGSNYLVVWQAYDLIPDDVEIFGVRVDLNGLPIDGTPFAIPSAGRRQRAPAISFDGTNYLVVWEDERSGVDFDIYGARVSPSGFVLDTIGIPISTEVEDQLNPAIAFDGINYLVVWQNELDTFPFVKDFDIHGRRISVDGTVLDTNDIIIGRDSLGQISPSITFDGTCYLVTWMDRRRNLLHNFDLFGARVDPNGTVLDTAGIQIAIANHTEYYSAVASNGLNHLIVWRGGSSNLSELFYTQYNILGARVDGGGSLLDSLPFSISNSTRHQRSPDLDFDGNNALVSWSEGYYLWDGRVPGIRVNTGGTISDPIPVPIFQYYDISKERDNSSVSYDGTNFLVVSGFTGLSESEGSHIDTSGAVLDSFSIPAGRWNRAISFDGTNHLILWNQSLGRIEGLRVDPAGNVLDSLPFEITPNLPWSASTHPAVAFDGTNYLVIWIGMLRIQEPWIYAGRITPDGIPIDSSGIVVSEWGPFDFRGSPVMWRDIDKPIDLAFDGTQYLAVWEDIRNDGSGDNSDIYGARITPDGTVLDTSGIPISTEAQNQLNPSVTFDGNNFLVIWEDYRNDLADIYGTEVTSNGIVLNPGGVLISEGAYPNRFPELIRVGDGRSLIVYQSFRPTPYGDDRIFGRLFETSVGVEEGESFPISKFKLFQNRPNPFINSTKIFYTIPAVSSQRSAIGEQKKIPVRLVVYDIMGRRVKILVDEKQVPGIYQVEWDSKDQASGIYFYRL
ncbi:hypothetical protein IIA15_05290, partial [candidate division TA06 bacterium]|nr:hypothetical protein [candidate division TA06 bacterium]